MNKTRFEPLVSVIMPVYNTAPYLEKCINSVLNQTYNNLEIICVDDGSSDESGEILDRFAKYDARIKVIHTSNAGVSSARNTALRAATGTYIGFVDSDDYIASDYYEKLVTALKDKDIDIVTCSYYLVNAGEIVRAANKKKVSTESMYIKDFFRYMYERDTYKGVGSYLWTRLIKREIIKDRDGILKIYFKHEYGGIDDIVFVAEASLESNYIQYIDEPLYYYVQREGSIVHSNYKQLETLTWVAAYEWIIKIYQDHNIDEDILDIIRRMYVYRCGKLLETAIEIHNIEKIRILQNKIKKEFVTYVKTNMEHLERIQWILKLLVYEEEKELIKN